MNILVIYSSRVWPMRASQHEHLASFGRYAEGCSCFYLNLAFDYFPSYLNRVEFDLIIFNHSFLGGRVNREHFARTIHKISALRISRATKVCMPQDEFTSMDLLCDFINHFQVQYVFSVAPRSEWKKIYKTVDLDRVQFRQTLTGFLDEALVKKWTVLANRTFSERQFDIGYRVVATAIWGRFNLLKAKLAEAFTEQSAIHGFSSDIKVGEQYFKVGNDWLRFLADCRYTLGIEGGSRILDWDGSLMSAVTERLKEHPNATFDDLAASCVPAEREGEINVVAISPRHLEACLTRTAQVLVEGEYNGILKADVHYLALKSDLSNLSEVCERMKDETCYARITEAAFRDVVESGGFTYRQMVKGILAEVCGPDKKIAQRNLSISLLLLINKLHTILERCFLYLYSRLRSLRNRVLR